MSYTFVYRSCAISSGQLPSPVLESLLLSVLDVPGGNQKTCLPVSLSVRSITPGRPHHPTIQVLI